MMRNILNDRLTGVNTLLYLSAISCREGQTAEIETKAIRPEQKRLLLRFSKNLKRKSRAECRAAFNLCCHDQSGRGVVFGNCDRTVIIFRSSRTDVVKQFCDFEFRSGFFFSSQFLD